MQRRLPDTTRIQKLLGWSPRIGLDETIDAVRDAIEESPELGSAPARE